MNLYTLQQTAERIHRNEKTVRDLIKSGSLKARKAGRGYLISQAAIDEWFESLPEATTKTA